MVKSKKTQNVGMIAEGTLPSQIVLPGGFHIPMDGVNESPEAFGMVALQLGFTPKGLFYAIQYGLSQSLQDSVAGLAKALRDEKDPESGDAKHGDASIAAALHDAMKDRLAAIASGEIGHRTRGPQVRGVDKITRDVAWEAIVAAATARGLSASLPKKAAEIGGMIDKYLADEGRMASAKSEAERRLAGAKPVDDSFLADLVGGGESAD